MIIMFILKRQDQRMGDVPYKKWQSGTRFEDIDDNWICPDCGATKDIFEEVKE